MFRPDRKQGPDGAYASDNVDITSTFKAVFDMENIEVGYLMFAAGVAPQSLLSPLGTPMPQKPAGGDWKQGARFMIKLHASCGGDVREMSGNSASFLRGFDGATDGMYADTSHPATVSPFVLDRFEVTVGRFRAFVEAGGGTRPNPPSAGAGAHARIPGSGWDPNWNIDLVVDGTALSAALACDSQRQTWTAATGGNEDLPISCADWLEAMSFCIWDGGYLPTETEWHFAASGGAEQRAYPWSAPAGALTVDCSSANYSPDYVNGLFCTNTGSPNAVGAESPTGDGRWGHSDLGGNLDEWTLDSFAPYVDPCVDCANLDAFTVNNSRVVRGGDWANATGPLRSAHRAYTTPTGNRDAKIGFRCARPAI